MDYLCQQEGETVNTLSNYQVISSAEEREEPRRETERRRAQSHVLHRQRT